MDKITGILQTVLPVFLMLSVGILCRRKNIIQKEGIAGLKAFVFNITLPVLQFKGFYDLTYNWNILLIMGLVFITCLAAAALGIAYRKVFRSPFQCAPALTSGFAAGILGYPLYIILFGIGNISNFAMLSLGQEVFVCTAYLRLFPAARKQGGFWKALWMRVVDTPAFIGLILGILVGATGLGRAIDASAAGEVFRKLLEFVSLPTAAVILLVIGYELEFRRSEARHLISVVLARVVIMAVLGAALAIVLGLFIPMTPYILWALAILFILPPPYLAAIFMEGAEENRLVSVFLSLYTALSLVFFAVIAVIAI